MVPLHGDAGVARSPARRGPCRARAPRGALRPRGKGRAQPGGIAMTDCIFCKIVAGEIPSRKIYEDDEMLAFHDINPAAPVHFMIIPKAHIESLAVVDERHA